MSDRESVNADQASDGFLVDGVSPPVIGGDDGPVDRKDPPTAPLPAIEALPPEQKPSWLRRLFGAKSG